MALTDAGSDDDVRRLATTWGDWAFVGNVWTGTQKRTSSWNDPYCAGMNDDLEISLRLVDIVDEWLAPLQFVATTIKQTSEGPKLGQRVYSAGAGNNGRATSFQYVQASDPKAPQWALDINYEAFGGSSLNVAGSGTFGNVIRLSDRCSVIELRTAAGRDGSRRLADEDERSLEAFSSVSSTLEDLPQLDLPNEDQRIEFGTREINSCYTQCLAENGGTMQTLSENEICGNYFDMLGDMCKHCREEEPVEALRLQALCLEDLCHKNHCMVGQNDVFSRTEFLSVRMLVASPDDGIKELTSASVNDIVYALTSSFFPIDPKFSHVISIDTSAGLENSPDVHLSYDPATETDREPLVVVDVELGWFDEFALQGSRDHLEVNIDTGATKRALSAAVGVNITHILLLKNQMIEGFEKASHLGGFQDLKQGEGGTTTISRLLVVISSSVGALLTALAFFVRRHYHQKHKREVALERSAAENSGRGSSVELPSFRAQSSDLKNPVVSEAEKDRVPKKAYDMQEI